MNRTPLNWFPKPVDNQCPISRLWWTCSESNRNLSPCKGDALPIKLQAHISGSGGWIRTSDLMLMRHTGTTNFPTPQQLIIFISYILIIVKQKLIKIKNIFYIEKLNHISKHEWILISIFEWRD